MSKDQTPPDRTAKPSHREARAQALQRALRDNLRRRKAAGTSEAPQIAPPAADAPADETTRKNDE